MAHTSSNLLVICSFASCGAGGLHRRPTHGLRQWAALFRRFAAWFIHRALRLGYSLAPLGGQPMAAVPTFFISPDLLLLLGVQIRKLLLEFMREFHLASNADQRIFRRLVAECRV